VGRDELFEPVYCLRPGFNVVPGHAAPHFSQEIQMKSTSRHFRPLLLAAVVVALAATSGCHWFHRDHKSAYAQSPENRPLEVPPDLNLPDTAAAIPMPASSGLGGGNAMADAGNQLAGSATNAYPKIGAALESIPGVVINGRAEALGSFDVTYQGESFLVRVQDRAGGSRLMALSADGQVLTGGASAVLLAAIKAKL
jgi:hypothetical protein